MSPERFQKIEELYHAALEKSGEERAALLAQTDPELRREVESLLEIRGGEFLDQPAVQDAAELLETATLGGIAIGDRLGPYRIEKKLGQGGMGEVFLATDTRLGRSVAVKTTHERFGPRFEREARAISSLNHPHICTLYDVGPNYFVMELVEGETIAALLKSGPLPTAVALSYASQILDALVEAHAKGIVHRDLKPANIMIAKSGIKVLDFGLAKSNQDETLTATRMVIGTPAYMAPEQREGKTADVRSDIYSFGCILHEMLTGVRPSSQRKRIRAPKLDKIVSRCLEEDPARRWQSAAELQRELAAVSKGSRAYSAIAAAIVLAAAAAAWSYFHVRPKLTSKDTIVLAEFENNTKDPVFDHTLRQALSVQLQQSPFLALVSDDRVNQTLRLMSQPADAPLTPQLARVVCVRTGSSAVLEGSIDGLGSQYILWLRARNCGTGEVLAEEQAQTERKEDVLKALGRIADQMRTRLGESLASIQEHSTPLEQATTGSLEALQAYSAAKVARRTGGGAAELPHLRQAIVLDPQFAMAHADLGFMSWNLGQTDLGAEEVRIAYGMRDRVSDRERRYITMLYDREVTGNLQKELQTLESWAQTYPRDPDARGILGGWVSFGTGNYERGVQACQKAIELGPEIPFVYEGLAGHNIHLGRYAQAEDALQLAAQRKMEIPEFAVLRYHLAFLKDDRAGMDREVVRATAEHAEELISHHQALVLARAGRMRDARAMWERAIALARQAGTPETAAIYTAAGAVCEAHVGNQVEAKNRARAALDLSQGRDVKYAAAFALALSDELAESQGLAGELGKRLPEDTPVQFEYLPILNALSALGRKAPLDAVESLKLSVPYDYAIPGTAFYARFGGLYTVYVRGRAYLAAGQAREAAAEFQKILDHRGIVLADPIGALAYFQLGRAYAAAGDVAKAKDAYDKFLAIWKDADTDLPVLKEARAERAKL